MAAAQTQDLDLRAGLLVRASAQQGSPTGSRHARHGPSENRGLAAGRAPSSDLDVEAELDVTPRLAATDAPVLGRDLAQQDLHVVARDVQALQVLDDGAVQGAFRLQRPADEGVDADVCVEIRLFPRGQAKRCGS
jgi:hypothetical protein